MSSATASVRASAQWSAPSVQRQCQWSVPVSSAGRQSQCQRRRRTGSVQRAGRGTGSAFWGNASENGGRCPRLLPRTRPSTLVGPLRAAPPVGVFSKSAGMFEEPFPTRTMAGASLAEQGDTSSGALAIYAALPA